MIISYICGARQKQIKMSQLNELKKKMFDVIRSSVKFSLNFQGKGTILENKNVEYKMQLLENIDLNYDKLTVDSPDFNVMLSKARKILPDLQSESYTEGVRKFVNDVAFMFENGFKSIAKKVEITSTMRTNENQENVQVLKKENHTCSCGQTNITHEEVVQFRSIKENKTIKCTECNEVVLILLTPDNKLKTLLNKEEREEEKMDMSSLNSIGDEI